VLFCAATELPTIKKSRRDSDMRTMEEEGEGREGRER
jgi:hypothetical protein